MLDYAFKVTGHGADYMKLKLLKQVCSYSMHDGRQRAPHDAHARRRQQQRHATKKLRYSPATHVPMCADVITLLIWLTVWISKQCSERIACA